MKIMTMALVLASAIAPVVAHAQWTAQRSGTDASLRGLSVPSAQVAWASGTGGVVTRTIDGGGTWRAESIPGAAKLDVRSIHALDANVAHAAATAGRIWRTRDGGRTWSLQWQSADTTVFLDAIAFWDPTHGIAMGDPQGGRFLLLVTNDGGDSWTELPAESRPAALPGEAAFAASGTSLVVHGTSQVWIGTGGGNARVFRSRDRGRSWEVSSAPIAATNGSSGIFSLSFADERNGFAAGGDYQKPGATEMNAAQTSDGGVTWRTVKGSTPAGYRSGVAHADARTLVAVGTSGTDVSLDGGGSWRVVDATNLNSVRFAGSGAAGWAVGGGGRIVKWSPGNVPARNEK